MMLEIKSVKFDSTHMQRRGHEHTPHKHNSTPTPIVVGFDIKMTLQTIHPKNSIEVLIILAD